MRDELSGKTRLRLIDELQICVRSGKTILKMLGSDGDQFISTGSLSLAILDAFRKPRTMVEALEVLKPRIAGRQAWVDATADIMELHRVGFLVDADEAAPKVRNRPGGFDSAEVHVAMLDDRRRTDSFLAGVRAVVRPGDVVVDLGTGTGLLAVAAAQAGASRVYAIERTGIGAVAEASFRANGYGDRIRLITGTSLDVKLPERADVLVGELIGNDPLDEHIIQYIADARRRLLKPAARLVPSRLQVLALPVAVPEALIRRRTFTPDALETWRSWYGIDFGALRNTTPSSFSFIINPRKLAGRVLGTPVLVCDFQLATIDDFAVHVDGAFDATASAWLNGVLIYFVVELGAAGIQLSTHPDQVGRDNHWQHRVWMLPEPFMVEPGERYRLSYSHQNPERPDGVQVWR